MTWRTFLKRPRRVALAVIATATAALTFHCPQREQVVITYRGAPEWVPEEYTLHQVLYPGRCVPLWSCDLPSRTPFGYWREPKRDTITATRRIGSRSTGTAFEINLARVLSLGAYRVWGMSLEAERPKEATGSRQTSPAKVGPEKRTKLPQRLFHILDFGTPSAFSIPLPVSPPGAEIVIDFDPIVYTRFEDLPDRDAWNIRDTNCTPYNKPLVVTPRIPRTLRYRTTAFPEPRAGQLLPASTGRADVFLVDGYVGRELHGERLDLQEWKQTLSEAVHPDRVRLAHDPVAKTITLEVTAPLGADDDSARSSIIIVAGTPSADGRPFGTDCVRLEVEKRDDFSPVLRTLFDNSQWRHRRVAWSDHCAHAESFYPPLVPGVARTLRYHTTLWPEPKAGQSPREPKGSTDVFLIEGAAAEELDQWPTAHLWKQLKQRAIHPKEVGLEHDPAGKTVTVKVTDSLKGDYAIVAGMVSNDGRFFGVDCVRLGAESVEDSFPILYTQLDDVPPRGAMKRARCGLESISRIDLTSDAVRTVRYHTEVRPVPKSEQPVPTPLDRADVFLVDGATADKIDERSTPDGWKQLKARAIHPDWLGLDHNPETKAITLTPRQPPPKGDYALVIGTPSFGDQAFGVDCIRLDTRVTALAPGGTKPP